MQKAFRAFMEGMIDYAGLFPPARLDLHTALDRYDRYRNGPESWMIARFVIPGGRLSELEPYAGEIIGRGNMPFRLSVLAGGGDTEGEALQRLGEEGESIRSFLGFVGKKMTIETVETRLPHETAEAAKEREVIGFLEAFSSTLGDAIPEPPALFVEVAPSGDSIRTDGAAIRGMAGLATTSSGRDSTTGFSRIGFKLRSGGPEPGAFPPVGRVASVIQTCVNHRIPLKCTAGLHHPLRHHDEAVGVMSHGFFNIFGAGILAYTQKLLPKQIEQCLSDENSESFTFENCAFSWQGIEVSTRAVEAARREFAIGFGSCSFEEPRDHLQSLGLLD
jgi:hypothetical protein